MIEIIENTNSLSDVFNTAVTIGLPAFITFLATRHTNNNNLKSEVSRYKNEIKKVELNQKNSLDERRREYNLKNIEDISLELNKYYKIVENLITVWHSISMKIKDNKVYLKDFPKKEIFKDVEKSFIKSSEFLTFATTKLNMINAANIIESLGELDRLVVEKYNKIAVNEIPLMKELELNKLKNEYVDIKNKINKDISFFVNKQFLVKID